MGWASDDMDGHMISHGHVPSWGSTQLLTNPVWHFETHNWSWAALYFRRMDEFNSYLLCSDWKPSFQKPHFIVSSLWHGKHGSHGSQWAWFDDEVTHRVLGRNANLSPTTPEYFNSSEAFTLTSAYKCLHIPENPRTEIIAISYNRNQIPRLESTGPCPAINSNIHVEDYGGQLWFH